MNSTQEFCQRTDHMIKELHLQVRVFTDGYFRKGPTTTYHETIKGILKSVASHTRDLHHTLILLGKAGVTMGGNKFIGATPALQRNHLS